MYLNMYLTGKVASFQFIYRYKFSQQRHFDHSKDLFCNFSLHVTDFEIMELIHNYLVVVYHILFKIVVPTQLFFEKVDCLSSSTFHHRFTLYYVSRNCTISWYSNLLFIDSLFDQSPNLIISYFFPWFNLRNIRLP